MPSTILYQVCASQNMRTEDAIRLFDYCIHLREERRRLYDSSSASSSGNGVDPESLSANIEIQCDNLFREAPAECDVQRIGSVTAICPANPPNNTDARPSASSNRQPSTSRAGHQQDRRSLTTTAAAASSMQSTSPGQPAGHNRQQQLQHAASTSSNSLTNGHTSQPPDVTVFHIPSDISVTIKQERLNDEEITVTESGIQISSQEIQFVGQVDIPPNNANGTDNSIGDSNGWEKIDGQSQERRQISVASPTRSSRSAAAAAATSVPHQNPSRSFSPRTESVPLVSCLKKTPTPTNAADNNLTRSSPANGSTAGSSSSSSSSSTSSDYRNRVRTRGPNDNLANSAYPSPDPKRHRPDMPNMTSQSHTSNGDRGNNGSSNSSGTSGNRQFRHMANKRSSIQ